MEEIVHDIEQLQCLRALRLEGNSVGVEAAQAIAKALEGKDLLQVPRCVVYIYGRSDGCIVHILLLNCYQLELFKNI